MLLSISSGRTTHKEKMSGRSLEAGLDIGLLENKRFRWEGSRLRSIRRPLEYQQKLKELLVESALPKFEDGTFKVMIERKYSWRDIETAHELLESNQSEGKIICHID